MLYKTFKHTNIQTHSKSNFYGSAYKNQQTSSRKLFFMKTLNPKQKMFVLFSYFLFFLARRFEKAISRRPNTVKCFAVKWSLLGTRHPRKGKDCAARNPKPQTPKRPKPVACSQARLRLCLSVHCCNCHLGRAIDMVQSQRGWPQRCRFTSWTSEWCEGTLPR